MMKKNWWKLLSVILIVATILLGFFIKIPQKPLIRQSMRNYFFHPPMWFVMMINFTISVVYSIKYLRSNNLNHDVLAKEYSNIGLYFGFIGLLTGMFWANYTWGRSWVGDPKLISTGIALLIYSAYFVLRGSMPDMNGRAKLSAVYNIFAYAMLFPTIFILPRLTNSLHPGSSGNPALDPNDIEPKMFIIFWCVSVPGWLLFSFWMTSLRIRILKVEDSDFINR